MTRKITDACSICLCFVKVTKFSSNLLEACIAVIFLRVQQVVVLAWMYCVVLQFNCSKDITLMEVLC